jgi:hypothetical protein
VFAYFLGSVPFRDPGGACSTGTSISGDRLEEVHRRHERGAPRERRRDPHPPVGRGEGDLPDGAGVHAGRRGLLLAFARRRGRLLGHIFPIYLNFKGGKGVATALGVVLALSPVTTFVLVVLFSLVVYFTRYISLGSLCAAVALPILMALLGPPSRSCVTLSLLIAFLVIYNHRENIHRLLSGRRQG